jgi:hypothetical protein
MYLINAYDTDSATPMQPGMHDHMRGNEGMGCGSMMGGDTMGGSMMMHGGNKMHMIRGYAMMMQLRAELGLTADQIGKIQSQVLDYIRTVAPIKANIEIAEAEKMMQLAPLLEVQGPALDMNTIQQKIQQLETLKGNIELATIKLASNLKGILTTEQLQKLQSLVLNMVNRMHGRGMATCPWQNKSMPQQQPTPPQQGTNPPVQP